MHYCRILSLSFKAANHCDLPDPTIMAPALHMITVTTGLLFHHLQADAALSFLILSNLRLTRS